MQVHALFGFVTVVVTVVQQCNSIVYWPFMDLKKPCWPFDIGNDDTDEVTPLKLKETKRFKDRKVIGLEIGGQMALLLTVPAEGAAPQAAASKGAASQAAASNAAAAAAVVATSSLAEGSTHAPPEPAPADADASAWNLPYG